MKKLSLAVLLLLVLTQTGVGQTKIVGFTPIPENPLGRPSLVACWPLNEVSGDALDTGPSSYTLTAKNSPGSATGHVYALSRETSVVGLEVFYRSGFTLYTPATDNGFTAAGWVYLTATPVHVNRPTFIGHGNLDATIEVFSIAPTRAQAYYVNVAAPLVLASTPTLADATWYFLAYTYDKATQTLKLSVNAGTIYSTVGSVPAAGGSSTFSIGAVNNVPQRPSDARYNAWALWNENLDLVDGAITTLYNNGAGLQCPGFS